MENGSNKTICAWFYRILSILSSESWPNKAIMSLLELPQSELYMFFTEPLWFNEVKWATWHQTDISHQSKIKSELRLKIERNFTGGANVTNTSGYLIIEGGADFRTRIADLLNQETRGSIHAKSSKLITFWPFIEISVDFDTTQLQRIMLCE